MENWTSDIANDMQTFDDDLEVKSTGAHGEYPKLSAFEECRVKYMININWVNIEIVVNKQECAIYAFPNHLPANYRKIQFVTHGARLGRQINLQGKTTDAIQARLNKAKGAWGIIKHGAPRGPQIKMEINSIYGTHQ